MEIRSEWQFLQKRIKQITQWHVIINHYKGLLGAFHSGKIPEISVRNQMNGSCRFGPTGIFGDIFEDGQI